GNNWKTIVDEWAEFLEYCDEKHVVLDIDPRRVTRAGLAQPNAPDQDGKEIPKPVPGANGKGDFTSDGTPISTAEEADDGGEGRGEPARWLQKDGSDRPTARRIGFGFGATRPDDLPRHAKS